MITYWLTGRKRVSDAVSSDALSVHDPPEMPGEITHAARSEFSIPLQTMSTAKKERKMTAHVVPHTVIAMPSTSKMGELDLKVEEASNPEY